MTLQYRIRSKSEVDRWRRRVRLTEISVLQAVDAWCAKDEADFPAEQVVAGILYLFSPRCEPIGLREHDLLARLASVVRDPLVEYSSTWPQRDKSESTHLVESMKKILDGSAAACANAGLSAVSVDLVVQQIVDQIVGQQ
jgi:hypothetical protein